MSIYLKCCRKEYPINKNYRKCPECGKSFTKYVAKVKDNATGKWKTKTVQSLKLARDIESKFKTELIEGKLFDSFLQVANTL